MLGTFNEEARQPNFPGLLVDFDHFSHDPAQPTTPRAGSAGWSIATTASMRKFRWSDLGHQALTGGRYRLASPVVEPGRLRSVDRARAGWPRRGASASAAARSAGADERSEFAGPRRRWSNRAEQSSVARSATATQTNMNLRTEILQRLHLARHGDRRRDRRGAAESDGGAGNLAQSLPAPDGDAGRERPGTLRRRDHKS